MTLIDFFLLLYVLSNYWFWACFIGVMSQTPNVFIVQSYLYFVLKSSYNYWLWIFKQNFLLIMTHFGINVQNLLYKSFQIRTFYTVLYWPEFSGHYFQRETGVFIQYCGVHILYFVLYIQYFNAFPILSKHVGTSYDTSILR